MLLKMLQTENKKTAILNNSGSSLIFVLVIAVIGNILIASVLFSNRYSTQKSMVRREKVSVINIAEAGKEHFYSKLLHEGYNPQKDSIEKVFNEVCIDRDKGKSAGYYSLWCSTGTFIDTMKIKVKGMQGTNSSMIEVLLTKKKNLPIMTMSARCKNVVVSKSNVSINGNITIDGRDYDTSNNMIGGGTHAIVSGGTVDVGGSAAVGGNTLVPVGKKDYDKFKALLSKENVSMDSTFNTPESYLGVPAGSLDQFQVTAGELSTPFNSIVYVTESVSHVNLDDCSGILIVHNAEKNAHLHINQGNFKGLIICDIMDKANGNVQVLGAVVTLGDEGSSHFGNGNAVLHYSKQTLDNLKSFCKDIKWEIEELAWRELVE